MVSELDIRKYKETLLEFLGDVTTIQDDLKKYFIEGNMCVLVNAPKGYKVLSPFLLVKVQESTRAREMPTVINVEGFSTTKQTMELVKPEIETYVCQIDIKLFTEDYTYIISANWREYTPQYLGCIIDSRKARAGEDWIRGDDMWDGHFCRETWNKIKDDIISHEMKGIAKYIVNGRYTREN